MLRHQAKLKAEAERDEAKRQAAEEARLKKEQAQRAAKKAEEDRLAQQKADAGRKAPRRKKKRATGKAKAGKTKAKRKTSAESETLTKEDEQEELLDICTRTLENQSQYSNFVQKIDAFNGELGSLPKRMWRNNEVVKRIQAFIKKNSHIKGMKKKQLRQFILKIKAMAKRAEGKYRSPKHKKSAKVKFEQVVKGYMAKSGLGGDDMTLELCEEWMNNKFRKELVYPRNVDLENRMWNYCIF